MKQHPADIIILHLCTINDNHIMYGSWDMKSYKQKFFVIFGHFLHFTPITTQKIKKMKKTHGDIICYNFKVFKKLC